MLLAEALAQRAEAQERLNQLAQRLNGVVRVQEGDVPDEDPNALLAEAEQLMGKIEELVQRINLTNSETPYGGGLTLSDAIAKRDAALRARRFYTSVADAASIRQDRYSRSEVRYISTINVAEVRAKADQASKQYRELDVRIQQLNWVTELR